MALTDGLIEYWKLDGNSNGVFGNRVLSAGEVKDLYSYGVGSQYPFRDKGFLSM